MRLVYKRERGNQESQSELK